MMILLDIDKRQRLPLRLVTRMLSRAGYTMVAMGERRSPSGTGWHNWIEVDPAPRSRIEVVALQAILGSDRWREASNLYRAQRVSALPPACRTHWNVLYYPSPARRRKVRLSDA